MIIESASYLHTGGGTGQESYHSRWREFEVMYHNSTLLPFAPDDPQQIQRKRHLGNGKTKCKRTLYID